MKKVFLMSQKKNKNEKKAENNTVKVRTGLLDGNSEDILSGKIQITTDSEAEVKRDKKRRRIYFLCVVAVSIIAAAFICTSMFMNVTEQLVLDLTVEETDLSDVSDGVYTASYSTAHMSAMVNVSILSGKMVDFELVSCTNIDRDRAQTVFNAVKKYQMLNVPDDDIGTQPTDKIVLKAIEAALSGANMPVAPAEGSSV